MTPEHQSGHIRDEYRYYLKAKKENYDFENGFRLGGHNGEKGNEDESH